MGGLDMKKIINGQRFNTETAVELGCNSIGYRNDFNFCQETLYKTPRAGNYFLHGDGGANSKYSVSEGQGSFSGGEKIIPMSRESAFEWAQENLDADDVEKEFSDLIQDA